MQSSTRPASSPSGPRLFRRIQIALPLALGLGLLIVFLVMLLRVRDDPPVVAEMPLPAAPESEVAVSSVPRPPHEAVLTEEEVISRPRPRPSGTGLKRWVIDPLPAGWDPELALQIAELCERIDYDPNDPESYNRAAETLKEFEEFLATLGPDALPTLEAILNAETFFVNRRRLLLAIGGLGPETEGATFTLVNYFKARMGDPTTASELGYVAQAIGRLKNATAFESMSELIGNENVPSGARANLIVQLGEHPNRNQAKPVFVDSMLSADEFKMRNYAAQAIGKIGTPDLLPDLMTAFDREPYWVAQQTILGSIGKIGDASAIPFLDEKARLSEQGGVRLSAASALRRVGTAHAWAILRELARDRPDPAVRRHIQRWLENP